MADGLWQRVRLILDKRSAEEVRRDSQKALKKGTDPKAAQKNVGLIRKAFLGLRAIALTLGPILASVFSIRVLGQFVQSVEESRRTLVRLTGAGGAALKTLQDDAQAVWRMVPETLDQVSIAIGNLNTLLRIHGEQLQRVTRHALNFARANEVDVAAATELVGRLINRFGLEAEHAEGLMDRLTVAGQDTGASVVALGNNLLQAGPALSAMGFSLNQQIALMAELERRGISASEVTNRLGLSLGRFAEGGAASAQEAFETLLREIREADTELQAVALATEAFGRRGAALALDIRSGAFEIEELTKRLQEADGALEETEESSRTLGDEIKILGNELLATFTPLARLIIAVGKVFVATLRLVAAAIEIPVQALSIFGARINILGLEVRRFANRLLRRDTKDIEAGIRAWEERIAASTERIRELYGLTRNLEDAVDDVSDAFNRVNQASEGANNVTKKTVEELIKLEQERIGLLVRAMELKVATNDERAEALVRVNQINRALERGNVTIEERIRLTENLGDLSEAAGLEAPTLRRLSLGEQATPLPPSDMDNLLRAGLPFGRVDPSFREQSEQVDEFADQWMRTNADLVMVAERAGFGIMHAFKGAFEAIAVEGQGIGGMMEALFRGIGGAALGALADLASSKVAENIAFAAENFAKSLGWIAMGNVASAGAAKAAAGQHLKAAGMWAVLGGGAAAGQSAVGGQSGGIPSGARDPAGRMADGLDRIGPDIIIRVDGVDPKSPRHQELVGKTAREYQQRFGGRIRVEG